MKTSVIIVAAGMGKRMQSEKSKQLIRLGGHPIIWHTLAAFQAMEAVDAIVLVTKEDEQAFIKTSIVEAGGFDKVKKLAVGGKERSDSVYNGLQAVEDADIVLIHDGARPFIDEASIERLIEGVQATGSAILAVPVKDTIKDVDGGQEVVKTFDRSRLWAVQTPQGFLTPIIKEAFEADQTDAAVIYDDAMLVEAAGIAKTKVVMGNEMNIKMTTPFDLIVGEAIYRHSKGETNV